MYAKLSGVVDTVMEEALILDVGGVGYLVSASTRTLAPLKAGEPLALLIDTQVREDAIQLFGFPNADEQRWFRLLQSVQGVGGRVALSVLSVLAPADLALAIASQDKTAVARANGVGPKLAMRIVNELKDKAPPFRSATVEAVAADPARQTMQAGPPAEALSALINLGFKPMEAARAVSAATGAEGADAPVNRLIAAALKEAARQ